MRKRFIFAINELKQGFSNFFSLKERLESLISSCGALSTKLLAILMKG